MVATIRAAAANVYEAADQMRVGHYAQPLEDMIRPCKEILKLAGELDGFFAS